MPETQFSGQVVLSSQLTSDNSGLMKTDMYSQTARPLDVIQQDIQSFISHLGFSSFRYSSIPASLIRVSENSEPAFELPQRADGREGFGTIPAKVLTKYYKTIASMDELWPQLVHLEGPLFYEPSAEKAKEFFQSHGINSQLFLPMRWQTGLDWFCIFVLQSNLPVHELKEHYETIHHTLNARALGWHLELMAFRQEKFNPYIVRKVLTPRTRYILKLAGEGYSSSTIAKMTGISDNGVNYHYREAKRILGARNRTHLVALAKDQKLI